MVVRCRKLDRFTLYFLLTVPLYFGLLHLAILPLLQKASVRIQGTRFTHRLQAGAASKTKSPFEKYDLGWSLLANVLALILAFIPFVVIEELGCCGGWFGAE